MQRTTAMPLHTVFHLDVPPFTLSPTEAKRFTEIDGELQHLSYASHFPLIEALHEEQDRLGRP